jgi:hypothetical protein
MKPGACSETHQQVHAELIYLAALDIGNARLSDSELPGGLNRANPTGEPAGEPT